MKRKKIIIMIIIIILVLVLAAAVVLLPKVPLLAMKPAPTGKISGTEITAIANGSNNIYLLNTEDGYILVDAGSDSLAALKSFEELSVNPDDVKHILLTHTDYDHVAALDLFKNAHIYIGENEMQMIDGTTRRSEQGGNYITDNAKKRLELLTDGEKLEIGGHTAECIAAAGHTPGSMAFLIDDKYLFTGDEFAAVCGFVTVHPYTMDSDTAKLSIAKLKPVFDRSELVLTGHYGYYNSDKLK